MNMIQAPQAQEQTQDYTVVGHTSTKALCSYLVAHYTLVVISLLQQEEDWHLISPPQRKGKTEPEEAYSADTTQHNSLYTSKQAPTKLSMPLCVTEE